MEAVVANETGVLRVDLGERFETRKMVYRAIIEELGDRLADEFPDSGVDVLSDLFRRVSLCHRRMDPSKPDWVPTLIAEVRTGIDDSVVYEVATAMKALNTDRRWCRVILLLSDANAAFALPTDNR